MKAKRLRIVIREQAHIGRRGRADLQVGSVVIEIKESGIFSEDSISRHPRRAKEARVEGLHYLFIAGQEAHRPYRSLMAWAVTQDNAFFLDTPGQWNRFVRRLLTLAKRFPLPRPKSA